MEICNRYERRLRPGSGIFRWDGGTYIGPILWQQPKIDDLEEGGEREGREIQRDNY